MKMRQFAEDGKIGREPIGGNKFNYFPKNEDWSDRPLNKFIGGD